MCFLYLFDISYNIRKHKSYTIRNYERETKYDKFMKAIKQVVPEKLVSIPNQLASIKDKKEDFVVLPDNIDKVREYILSSVS